MREGYWKTSDPHSELPWPVPCGTWTKKLKERFLKALAKKEKEAEALHCKGSSYCRLCGETNGSVTYSLDGWLWPSGYRHYIEDHNVRPSLAFEEWVIGEVLT